MALVISTKMELNPGSQDSLDILYTDEWTGIPESDDIPWGAAKPKPCPYTFIYSGEKCVNEQDKEQIGMVWDNILVKPAENQQEVENIEHVKSIFNEEVLDLNESFTDRLDSLGHISQYYELHVATSIVSMVFSVLSFGTIIGLLIARVSCSRKRFTTSILGVPLIYEDKGTEMIATN